MNAAACTIDRCDECTAKLVCRCLQMTEEQLARLITALDVRTVRELRRLTGAGDGCTCCHPQLNECVQRYSLAVIA